MNILSNFGAAAATSSLPIIETTGGCGIPFAAPPTGKNRWTPPKSVTPWSDVLNATSFSPSCAQKSGSASVLASRKSLTSEDCLYLNIWTPTYKTEAEIAEANLPVFLWIYGGRFVGGSGDVITYDGTGLASKDIIVVTINYRLGPFGYLAHPELSAVSGHNSSGNYGILDQQFALRWVVDKIAQFGGNSSQITVGRQSAGSASALDVMWSPLVKGLAQGVIAESGARGPHDPVTGSAVTSYRTKGAAERQGVRFLKTMNVSSIDELRNVPMQTLLEYDSLDDTTFANTQFENLTSGAFMEPPMWRPNIDGYVLRHSYGQALRLNAHADIPILTGNNKDESGAETDPGLTLESFRTLYGGMFGDELKDEFFKLYPASNASEANQMSNELFRDLSRVGTWNWAVDWTNGGVKSNVYTYYFDHYFAEDKSEGAYHGSELANWTQKDIEVEYHMSNYWANFIRTGNPNEGSETGVNLIYFPPTVEEKKKCMWLGNSWGNGPISASEARIEFIKRWEATLQEW
ncbi:hypothetical protein N7493_000365 [Penicillium malachiteum]|uniref:Carboxylesterase type B domain-containing protein n=1 Tax=Penicillium malachiteum TaxID=1324776 RepID=A0AAD6HWT8_9EURO|nr:hypothetical protein N7493_000365 [Penicillium malachiteum]